MIRSLCTFAVLVGACVYSTPADAQLMHDFCRSVKRDFKRNNCWPEPFLAADRVAVRAPFNIMVHNGWQRQNMIGDYHFDESGQQLNTAGELKINWILTETPRHHRTIYVHRAKSKEETDIRITTVRVYATSILPKGKLLAIEETNIGMSGWSAERVSAIIRQFQELEQPDLEKILDKPKKD
jgi:hypothetical protein